MSALLKFVVGAAAAAGLAAAACPAVAQRGIGKEDGVARLPVRPQVVTLTGTVVAIHVGPCENTTGHGRVGVHLIVEPDSAGEQDPNAAVPATWNIHVGPQAAVRDMVAQIPLGAQISVDAFRTEQMPADHYVARVVEYGDVKITLRDEDLRPTWAGGGGPNVGRPPAGSGGGGPRRRGGRGWGSSPRYARGQRPCPNAWR